jgi:4-nitrophenyl phosphatase
MSIDFNRFSTFIFDLDGTIWKWNRLVSGAKETIERLQKEKKQVLFITNNTMLSRYKLTKKIWRFDIDVKYKNIVNSGLAAAKYFKQRMKRNERVLAISKGLRDDLTAGKVKTTNRATADYVVVGHDIRFDYMKLLTAVEALRCGAKLYATARGRYFVMGNDMWPGTGVLVEAIEYASRKKARLLGKPSTPMLDVIRDVNKSWPSKTVLIGDEIKSDIAAGKKLGYYTILVKTGVDRSAKVKRKMRPDLVVKSVADIKI